MHRLIAWALAACGVAGAVQVARRIAAAQPVVAAPQPPAPAPVDLQKDEYAALQKEIETDLKELSELERNTVLAAALVYSWLTTKAGMEPPVSTIAWAVPVVLPIYGAARTYAVAHQLALRGAYLQTVERRLFPAGGGWQCYFSSQRDSVRTTNRVRRGFWLVFFALCIVSSGFGGRHSARSPATAAAAAAAASAPQPAGGAASAPTPPQ